MDGPSRFCDALVRIAAFIVYVMAKLCGVSFLTFKIVNLLALASPHSLGEICSEVVILEAEARLASSLGIRVASWVADLVGRS